MFCGVRLEKRRDCFFNGFMICIIKSIISVDYEKILTNKYFWHNLIIWDAGIAQLVEYKLPKLGVASSNLVARSMCPPFHL